MIGLGFGRAEPMNKKDRVAEAFRILQMVGLERKINHAAEGFTLVEKKHLEIARTLATAPEVLLLDEVVSALNPTEITRTVETIRQIQNSGITVIMIEHILKVVLSLCERVKNVIEAYIGKFEDGEDGLHA